MTMSIRFFNGINSGSNYVHMPNYRSNNVVVNKFYLRGDIH